MSDVQPWHNAIVGYGEEDPQQLLAHPLNFRVHPKAQQDALSGAIGEVGWIAPVIVNRLSGNVIDGHLRVELAISRNEPSVPVAYVELSDEAERIALATFDPIGALAVQDQALLDQLLVDSHASDQQLVHFLATLRTPEFEPSDIDVQGKLDEKNKVTCPECGHEFIP